MGIGFRKDGLRIAGWSMLLCACNGDGYRSPTAPLPPPSVSPQRSDYVSYVADSTSEQGETHSVPWRVKISGNEIVLVVEWGQRDDFFDGRIEARTFSAVAHPPYLDPAEEVTQLRLVGTFSEDFSSFEATMTAIVGQPETDRYDSQWVARRVDDPASGSCLAPGLAAVSEVATPGTYTRVTPQCVGDRDRTYERLVLLPDGVFRLETEGGFGVVEDRGTYSRHGDRYDLEFERWYTAGSLTAVASFRGGCVTVDYNYLLELNGDYTDAEYCR